MKLGCSRWLPCLTGSQGPRDVHRGDIGGHIRTSFLVLTRPGFPVPAPKRSVDSRPLNGPRSPLPGRLGPLESRSSGYRIKRLRYCSRLHAMVCVG